MDYTRTEMVVEKSLHNRILYIDFLKFVGLMCIILAHVNPPKWLFMLRNFDVQLMVIISAILGQVTYQKHKKYGHGSYIFLINRTKRLLFPVWIFLFVFFTFQFLDGNLHDVVYYLCSFLLTRYGVEYVWIILVYLYCALLIPIIDKLVAKKHSWFYVGAIYIIYEIIYYFRIGANSILLDSTIYYIIPFGMLTYIGFNYQRLSEKTKSLIILGALLVFVGGAFFYWKEYGVFQDVQIVKYPPRAYYLSYGVLVSFVLLSICEKAKSGIYNNRVVVFTAKHSMWIYLWHIMVLSVYEDLNLPNVWYMKFVIVYLVSVIIVMGVNKILDIIEKNSKYTFFKYLRG